MGSMNSVQVQIILDSVEHQAFLHKRFDGLNGRWLLIYTNMMHGDCALGEWGLNCPDYRPDLHQS
jgi:hypothetical protein